MKPFDVAGLELETVDEATTAGAALEHAAEVLGEHYWLNLYDRWPPQYWLRPKFTP